ncbi:hypothetical protein [Paenibacillus cremeus]|uniref:Uncharacterized protein n=1 Tax=Paenibacillus cremeus TaxID=2163881 RepID=A0A559KCN6_9BACL|nr:hypothetical protein [Paenibacillus cremeus]TVY09891.1 hypothetical protein FPZ49_11000 [Paenibacillus cremeus]
MQKKLSSIKVDGRELSFEVGFITVTTSGNGMKFWTVGIDGAQNELTSLLLGTRQQVNLEMICDDGVGLKGNAIPIRVNELQGAGALEEI